MTELARWADHDLEALGRLTYPMRWDRPAGAAFGEIGRELRVQGPKQVVFYQCGIYVSTKLRT
jgi:hypothetical protein